MNKLRNLLFYSMLFLTALVFSDEQNKADNPYYNGAFQIKAELVDGSFIIGTPSVLYFNILTPYAEINVVIHQIKTIHFRSNQAVSLEMQNGDKISGRLNLEFLESYTIFGKVLIETKHIKSIAIHNQKPIKRTSTNYPGIFKPQEPIKNPNSIFYLLWNKEVALHYSFRESAKKIIDKSRKKNHGKVYGAKWTGQGRMTGAYHFNGIANFIVVPTSKSLQFGKKDCTIQAWIKLDKNVDLDTDYRTIVHQGSGRSTSTYVLQVIQNGKSQDSYKNGGKAGADGSIRFLLRDKNNNEYRLDGDTPVSNGKWHHVAGVYEHSRHTMHVYIDGRRVAYRKDAKLGIIEPDTILKIGAHSKNDIQFFKGVIDEVMIFKRALSLEEIKWWYKLPD